MFDECGAIRMFFAFGGATSTAAPIGVHEMERRDFLSSVAATGLLAGPAINRLLADDGREACHSTYATIEEAMQSPPEKYARHTT